MKFTFKLETNINTQRVVNALSRAMKPVVLEAADILQQEEKMLVPVDTGALQASIHIEEREDGPSFYEVSVHPAELAANQWGLDPAYARRIEYGFVGTDSLGRNYNQAAQPFVRPAWDTQKENMRLAIRDGLAAALEGI